MRKKLVVIKIILIFFISTSLTQVGLARGFNLQGYVQWKNEYSRDKYGISDSTAYSDYEFELGRRGVLFNPQIGYYDLGFNYRDYLIRPEELQPKVTGYYFNTTNLFPNSSMSLGLNTSQRKREYQENKEATPVDTVSKASSISFYTPLPYGLRLRSKFNKRHNFDITKDKMNNKNRFYNLKLNKNLGFSFMNTKIIGEYSNTTTEDLISHKEETLNTTKTIRIKNYLRERKDFFTLTQFGGQYNISNHKDNRTINYRLNTNWHPLKYLTLQTNHVKRIKQNELKNGKFADVSSTTNSSVNFNASPYPILNFRGGLQTINSGNTNELLLDFGSNLSYWDSFPIDFEISNESRKVSEPETGIEENRVEDTDLNLDSEVKLENLDFDLNFSNSSINKFERSNKIFSSRNTTLSFKDEFYNIDSNLKVTNKIQREFNDNSEISKEQESMLSLKNSFPKIHFGDFTLNSSYKQTLKQETKEDKNGKGERSTSNAQGLGLGLRYQKKLSRYLSLTGSSQYYSNLKSFDSPLNYNVSLKYNPYGGFSCKGRVEGYHEDEKNKNENEERENYRRWQGKMSYTIGRSRLNLLMTQNSNLNSGAWSRVVNLRGSHGYRAITIALNTVWTQKGGGDETGETIQITTSILRSF
jgi:hypothetical protein